MMRKERRKRKYHVRGGMRKIRSEKESRKRKYHVIGGMRKIWSKRREERGSTT